MKKIKLIIAYIVLFLTYPKRLEDIINNYAEDADERVFSAVFGKEERK